MVYTVLVTFGVVARSCGRFDGIFRERTDTTMDTTAQSLKGKIENIAAAIGVAVLFLGVTYLIFGLNVVHADRAINAAFGR